jgi:hypothetical protein
MVYVVSHAVLLLVDLQRQGEVGPAAPRCLVRTRCSLYLRRAAQGGSVRVTATVRVASVPFNKDDYGACSACVAACVGSV